MKRFTAILLSAALAACGGDQRPAPDTPVVVPPDAGTAPAVAVAPDAGVTPDAAVTADSGPPPLSLARRLEVQDPGKEPRRVLRHDFKAGTRQRLRLVIKARVTAEKRTISTIELRGPLELEVTEVGTDGAARLRYTLGPITNASPTPAGASVALRADVPAKAKVSGGAVMTADGQLAERSIDPPTLADGPEAEVVKSMLSTALELPAEPVGKGARWQLTLDASAGGLGLTRVTLYELVDFAGTAARLRLTQVDSVRQPDGGVLTASGGPPVNSGEWLLRPGQALPEGRQKLRHIIPGESGQGELATELSIGR